MEDWATLYKKRLPILKSIARDIEQRVQEIIDEYSLKVDRVSSRAKSLESFLGKIQRKNYQNPLDDIQDQVGCRIVVLYKSDVTVVRDIILKEFSYIESKHVEQKPDTFDYEAHHFILYIPLDIKNRHQSPITFFELQISTLFQYAWSQSNHDLGYKTGGITLSHEDRRHIAAAAAQAWGADQMFDIVYRRHHVGKLHPDEQ